MENNEKELEERELKELELMNENENREFYVYVHIRLDNNTVFYVGKGTGNRAYDLDRSDFHNSVRDEYDCKVVIIKDKLTESQAFRLEKRMIEYYVLTLGYGIPIDGYRDFSNNYYLTNFTWGGEGASGMHHTEETKQKLREINKGKHYSEETKKKQSNSQKERWNSMSNERKEELGNIFSKNTKLYWDNVDEEAKKERFKHVSETRIKNGTAKGKNNPMYGKHHSKETIEKLSKKIICITTGEIFSSAKEASEKYGGTPKCAANKNYKTKYTINKNNKSQKLYWVYLEDYNNEYKGILINPINNKEE